MMKKILLMALLASAFCAFASAPAQAAAPAAGPTAASVVSGNWVGRIAGSDAYIAISVGANGNVLAYVCDGKRGRAAKTYAWFSGKARGNLISLRSKGIHLRADLTRGWAKGALTLPSGRTLRFDARPARGKAGLYSAQTTIDGRKVWARWVVLNDGSIRGATNTTGSSACKGLANQLKTIMVKAENGTATIQEGLIVEEILFFMDLFC